MPKSEPIFRDLATLIESGVPAFTAIEKLAHPSDARWKKTIKQLQLGRTTADSLFFANIISRFEKELLETADTAGRQEQGLRLIAETYERRTTRIGRLKSKLYFPMAVFVIAIMVRIVLLLSQPGQPAIVTVLVGNGLLMILGFMIIHLLIRALKMDSCQVLERFAWLNNADWYRLLYEQIVLGAIRWQMTSGIDAATGFQRCANLFRSRELRKQLSQAATYCKQGHSLTQAMLTSRIPVTKECKAVLNTAEHSGSIQTALTRYLSQQDSRLEQKIDSLFEWFPRLIYSVIAVYAISIIL